MQVEPFDRSVRYRGPRFFTFSVNNSFSMNKIEKKFMTVTPFFIRFYICVQIFITIERLIKIFLLLAYGSLKMEAEKRIRYAKQVLTLTIVLKGNQSNCEFPSILNTL